MKSMLMVGDDVPQVRTAIQTFASLLKQDHIAIKTVFIPLGSGASTVAADIQGAGGNSVNAWFFAGDQATCASVFGYQMQAGIHPLTMGSECIGAAFKQLTGGSYTPNGLIFPDFGWSVFLPHERPLQEAINAQIEKAVPNDPQPDSASLGFTQTLNMIRAMNAAGNNLSTQGIATAIRNLKAPVADNIGQLDCGGFSYLPTICGNEVGLLQSTSKGYVRLSPTAQIPAIKVWSFQSLRSAYKYRR
jgi:hypothetical protein